MSAEQRGLITSLDAVPVLLFQLLAPTAARVMEALVQLLSATFPRAVSAELPLCSHPQRVVLQGEDFIPRCWTFCMSLLNCMNFPSDHFSSLFRSFWLAALTYQHPHPINCKLGKSALHRLLQVHGRDIKQHMSPDGPLQYFICYQPPGRVQPIDHCPLAQLAKLFF